MRASWADSTKELVAPAGVLAVGLLLRLLWLDADPPADFHFHFLTDEGWWAHNARQHALFGKWILDDHNPALWVAPVHTLALRASYEIFGVGLISTRLVSAVAGALTGVVLYAVVRAETTRSQATWTGLLFATGYFATTYGRVALTESLGVFFAVLAAGAGLVAVRRPAWGVLGGFALVMAAGVKAVGAVVALPVALVWGLTRRAPDASFRWAGPALYVATAAATLLAATPWLLSVRWEILETLCASLATVVGVPERVSPRIGLGLQEVFGLRWTSFWPQAAIPVAGCVVLAVGRLTRAEPRPVDGVERLAWCWLAVVLPFLALQHYQPDRRFVMLVPPLCLLLGAAIANRGLALPGREGLAAAGRVRAALAGALVGSWLAFYGLHRLPLGGDGVDGEEASVALLGAALVAALLAVVAGRWLPRVSPRVPAAALVVLLALNDPVRLVAYLSAPEFTLRDAQRRIAAVAAEIPAAHRSMQGDLADGLALESDLVPFVIRKWNWSGVRMNLDGFERFEPALSVRDAEWRGRRPRPPRTRQPFQRLAEIPLWKAPDGGPRWRADLYVRRDLCPDCRWPDETPAPSSSR